MVIKYVVATSQMSTYLIHNDHTNTTITNFYELYRVEPSNSPLFDASHNSHRQGIILLHNHIT